MNNRGISFKSVLGIAVVLILATVMVTGCQKASSATGVVSEIAMSTGVDNSNRPVNITTTFPIDAAGFYCSFKMSGFPVGAKVEAKWIYVGGDAVTENVTGQNYVAETQTAIVTTEGQGYTYTVYDKPPIPNYTWPKGNYQVVISVDGLEKAKTYFNIQ